MGKSQLRYYARERLVQCLFQWDYTSSVDIADLEDNHHAYDHRYFTAVLEGVRVELSKIDGAITCCIDRDIGEVSKVELAVMRLACYEIMYREDIPFKVAIDQAARLNKKFGTAHGYKYINAVLDCIAKEYRQLEYIAAKEK